MASDEAEAWAQAIAADLEVQPQAYLTEAEEQLLKQRMVPHGGPTWWAKDGDRLALSERLVTSGMAKETMGAPPYRRFRLHHWARSLLGLPPA